MYEAIIDVPEVIKDFYYSETINEPTGEMIEESYEAHSIDPETGEPTGETETRTRQVVEMHDVIYVRQIVRPEFKSLADVERLMSLGKPKAVLDVFAELAATGYQWSWFDLYLTYQAELTGYQEAQAAFEPVTDEETGETSEFTGVEPTEPERPTIQTGSGVLAPYLRELFKASRAELVGKLTVTVEGMIFDGNEKAQDRMTRAVLVLDDVETTLWVLADNTVVEVTKAQMLMALRLSGEAQSALWSQA